MRVGVWPRALGDGLGGTVAFAFGEDVAPEVAGLGVVVVAFAVVVAAYGTRGGGHVGSLDVLGVLFGSAEAVGLVVGEIAVVSVKAHGAVAVVGGDGALGGVDGEEVVVGADAVAVSVGVGEEAALEHLVRRVAHAGEDVGGVEGGLLDLGRGSWRACG